MTKITEKILPAFFIIALVLISFSIKTSAKTQPWVYCKTDISCAAKTAGFNFPVQLDNYNVRAVNDMIEFNFKLTDEKAAVLRKTMIYSGAGNISGIQKRFPVNKEVTSKDNITYRTQGDKSKVYLVNYSLPGGYYSAYSNKGFTKKELKYLHNLITESELPKNIQSGLENENIANDKTEPVYTKNCYPKTLQRKGVDKICFERANLGQNNFCSVSQVKIIKEYFKNLKQQNPDGNINYTCAE